MPKENTHLLIAEEALNLLPEGHPHGKRKGYRVRNDYFLGSIVHDSFFYSEETEIADWLHHGIGDNTPTTFLEELANGAKFYPIQTFTLGFATHIAADTYLHPVVMAVSGNHHDPDPKKARKAGYLHKFFETALDQLVNGRYAVHRDIEFDRKARHTGLEVLAEILGIKDSALKDAVHKQLRCNRHFQSPWSYKAFKLFKRSPEAREHRGLFYADLAGKDLGFKKTISYRDIHTGETVLATPNELVANATRRAADYLVAVYNHIVHRQRWKKMKKVIPPADLDTGKPGLHPRDMHITPLRGSDGT